jgi:hypothetical protein
MLIPPDDESIASVFVNLTGSQPAILGESWNRYEAPDNRMFNRMKLARK